MEILLTFIGILILKLIFNPKIDYVDTNLVICWYGYKNRKYIKLFRI